MDELVKRLRNCATEAAPCKTCDMTEDGSCTNTLMKQAADAIEELQRQIDAWVEPERKALIKSLPRWISVTERLPEKNQIVVVVQHGKTWDYGQFRGLASLDGNIHKWNWKNNTIKTVDYWMPKKSALPEPPKEET